MMFKIGDIVVSRQTGLPAIGKVIGIFDPIYFLVSQQKTDIILWNKLYSDWKTKSVVMIKFNSPQRQLSFDEYMSLPRSSEEISEEVLEEAYDSMPAVPYSAYPEDDLELFSVESVDV